MSYALYCHKGCVIYLVSLKCHSIFDEENIPYSLATQTFPGKRRNLIQCAQHIIHPSCGQRAYFVYKTKLDKNGEWSVINLNMYKFVSAVYQGNDNTASLHHRSTNLPRDKMAAISQTTFSNAFSWKKVHEFRLSFFIRVQITIFQHFF